MTEPAAAETTERSPRRALLGAGVIGAALAAAGSRAASASTPGLSPADTELVRFAMQLELAARDLYDTAIADGAGNPVWGTIREQHEAYAQRLAGIAGLSADTRNEGAYQAFVGEFDGSPARAAFELENVAAATHVELLGRVVDDDAAAAIAAIVAMESRHAVVAGAFADVDDLDAHFTNLATPLSPEA